ncbi:MAG: AbrB/MazE/SpoVT family DNA-binding domain-containing protein [Oscillospiraceae bacterium]|jgi:AbrB family transcriptional regulator (stage V sporulation protein T)|nr:AbrB/MazE/SpoVT family DNA-binding domain-containing protein [Oscillospiraceae bacterium]
MKATGIVRRIDDLGRVVIPKEIRRTLHIRDGDPLEIYTEKNGEVIFKKYSPVGELSDFAAQICEALYKTGECVSAVCDRDTVIACAGVPKKELVDKRLSGGLSEIMDSRKLYTAAGKTELPLAEGESILCVSVAAPIVTEGDVMGCVAFAAKQGAPEPNEVQVKLATAVASFLGKQMEG